MKTINSKEAIYFEEYERTGKHVPASYVTYIVHDSNVGYYVVVEWGSKNKSKTVKKLKISSNIHAAFTVLMDNLNKKLKQGKGHTLVKRVDNINDFMAGKNGTSKPKPVPKLEIVFEIPKPKVETDLSAWL